MLYAELFYNNRVLDRLEYMSTVSGKVSELPKQIETLISQPTYGKFNLMARIGVSKTRMIDLKELFSSLKKEMRVIITIVIQSNVSGKVLI